MPARIARSSAGVAVARVAPALAAAGALLAASAAAAAPELRPLPLDLLRRIESDHPIAVTPRGVEMDVPGLQRLVLPFAVEEIELEAEASAPVLLTWAALGPAPAAGPPWRYASIPRTAATLRLDLRQAPGWTGRTRPLLVLDGVARVRFREIRVRPAPADAAAAAAALDRAALLAPESVGHTTVNVLTPSFWSVSRGVWLADVVAAVAAAAAAAALAALRVRTGRWRGGPAVACGALLALVLWDAHFLVRFLPMANLRPTPDREQRIRDNHYFAPDLGALAALARATLGPDERVGALAPPEDWYSPETLCFNLAPRPCVLFSAGEEEHAGIEGVGRLRTEEIDALVVRGAVPLPEGFVPVAAVSPRALVARRR